MRAWLLAESELGRGGGSWAERKGRGEERELGCDHLKALVWF